MKIAAETVSKGYNPLAKEFANKIAKTQKLIPSGKKRKAVVNQRKIKKQKLDDLAGFKNLFKVD